MPMLSNESRVLCVEWVCEYMRVCVYACVCECVGVPVFNSCSSIGLGCGSCVSGTILSNINTCAHTIHRPCSY